MPIFPNTLTPYRAPSCWLCAERIADGGILHLIKQWLKAPVVEQGKNGKDHISGGKIYPHAQPGKRAVKRIKAKLTESTGRNLTPIPLPTIVQRVNQSLRGWSGYFYYRNNTKVFGDVRWHAEDRLRTHLRKRHKVKARRIGQGRFPNRVLEIPGKACP